jgi:peptide/nickel transport system substrate-binding protein
MHGKRAALNTLVLLACAALPAYAAAQTVVVAETAEIRSTNPGVNRDDTTDGVILHIVEGLVGYRENGTVGPLLAEAVEVSPDKKTYTFKLRKNVKFQNGAPFTSADVLWNWKRYMDPKTDWRCRGEYDGSGGVKVEEVAAPDDYTVVMKIDHPYAVFLDSLARTDCSMTGILQKDSVKADGSWDKPIGTGPFMFGEWKRGEYVTLNAYKGYMSGAGSKPDGYIGAKQPLVDQVKFLVVPDPAVAAAGLRTGAIDVAQIQNQSAVQFKGSADVGVIVPREASKSGLIIQTRDPVLKNKKLRQAIAASLDADQIVAAASEGLGVVNNSAVQGQSLYYTDAQKKRFGYNPERAKKLLQESGYKGEKIVIYANKRAHVPSYQVAVLAQAMMQAVGINAQIEVLEWATQLDRYNRGNYQMSSFTYSSRLDPALSYEQFSGDKDKESRKLWENPEALKLIDQAFAEDEPAKRQALFDKLHAMMLDDVPVILLFNGANSWGVRKRLSGFNAWEGKPRLWETKVVTK